MLQGVREFRHIGCGYWTSDILRGPVRSRQDADLGMCRVDGVYVVTVCIRAHYMLVWGCSRVASGPFCACAAATATAVLFWWSVWLWSCCGVLGGRPLRWLVFRNTLVRWFVAEVTASTTPTHRAAVQERGNTDRTKDKENFLPRRDSRPSGACRASQKAY